MAGGDEGGRLHLSLPLRRDAGGGEGLRGGRARRTSSCSTVERQLFYRGQMDGSRPGNGVAVTGEDLRKALDAVLEGRPALEGQRPSLGCNIKWKPGNEPAYFSG